MEEVLVLVGDAAEDLDAMYPIYRLREAGYEVHVAAPTRRKASWSSTISRRDGMPTPSGRATPPGGPRLLGGGTRRVRGTGYPGGRAPEYIRNDPDVARICTYFFEQNLPVGLVCHGVQVPAALGLLRGRTVSGFPPLKPDLEAAVPPSRRLLTWWTATSSRAPAGRTCRSSRAFMGVLERAAVSVRAATEREEIRAGGIMARPVTLFTGQWADLPLEELAHLAKEMGYDGLELACWGDHFEVDKALKDDGYVERQREILEGNG